MTARPHTARLCALVCGLFVAGCGGSGVSEAPADGGLAIVDVTGDTVRLSGPARRIVSLVPSATAAMHTIGAENRLVGRTDYDEGDWLADVPSVGGGLEPSLEALVALEPDVVIRFAGEQDPTTPSRLDELGIPHVAVRPESIADVYEMVSILGRLTERDRAADALIDSLVTGLAEVRRSVEGMTPLRTAYVLGGTPPWVAGPGTYIHELMELVGAENVFADLPLAYASVSPEEFVARDIDVIVSGDAAGFEASLAPGARVEQAPEDLDLPGPALVETAVRLRDLIRGSRAP